MKETPEAMAEEFLRIAGKSRRAQENSILRPLIFLFSNCIFLSRTFIVS